MKTFYVLQGNYGGVAGWEDLTAEDTRDEILARKREYVESSPEGRYRIRTRTEQVPADSMSRNYQPHKITVALLTAWTDMGPNNIAESMVREAVRTDYGVDVESEVLDEWLAEWQESFRAYQS